MEQFPVDVLFLAQDVQAETMSGRRAMLSDFPKREGAFADKNAIIPAAEKAGIVDKRYDPDSGEWYIALTDKGVTFLSTYDRFHQDVQRGNV